MKQPLSDWSGDTNAHMEFLSKTHGHKGKFGQAGGPMITHHRPESRRGRRILKIMIAKINRKRK